MSNMEARVIKEITDTKAEVVRAFMAKFSLQPDEVMIDVRRNPNGKISWNLRKMTKAERESKVALQAQRDFETMKKAENGAGVVYGIMGKRSSVIRRALGLKPEIVGGQIFLSKRGAMEAANGRDVVEVKVRA